MLFEPRHRSIERDGPNHRHRQQQDDSGQFPQTPQQRDRPGDLEQDADLDIEHQGRSRLGHRRRSSMHRAEHDLARYTLPRMMRLDVATCVLALLAAACGGRNSSPPPRETAPAAAASAASATAASADWIAYNGPPAGDRYSPLAQITAANVGQLHQVCAFDAAEAVNFQSGIVETKGVL